MLIYFGFISRIAFQVLYFNEFLVVFYFFSLCNLTLILIRCLTQGHFENIINDDIVLDSTLLFKLKCLAIGRGLE